MSASPSATSLQLRLEQQRHWESAVAVRDGRQSRSDPDVHLLRELHAGERVYEDARGRFVKQLIDGAWLRVL